MVYHRQELKMWSKLPQHGSFNPNRYHNILFHLRTCDGDSSHVSKESRYFPVAIIYWIYELCFPSYGLLRRRSCTRPGFYASIILLQCRPNHHYYFCLHCFLHCNSPLYWYFLQTVYLLHSRPICKTIPDKKSSRNGFF